MTDQPTREDIINSIVPDSSQFNAEDCIGGPLTLTIERLSNGPSDKQPLNIHVVGHKRVFRPCKTVRRILVAAWKEYPDQWIGKRFTVYRDPNVLMKGVRVGGLRVSHVSGIPKPLTLTVSESQTKRVDLTVSPLPEETNMDELTEEEQVFIDATRKEIAAAESLDTLKVYAEVIKGKSKGIQDALRPAYKTRHEELKGAQ